MAASSISSENKTSILSNIGAGTSSLVLGTSGTTALAGNTALFDGAYSSLSGLPTLLALGTSSSTALAGNTALLALGTSSSTALAGNTNVNTWSGASTGLTASTALTSLGGTTFGKEVFGLADTGAVRFLRMDADNGVTALTAADFRTAINASAAGASNFAVADITGATNLATALAAGDSLIIHDTSASALREMSITQLTSYFNSASVLSNLAPIAQLTASQINAMTINANTVNSFTVAGNVAKAVPISAVFTDTNDNVSVANLKSALNSDFEGDIIFGTSADDKITIAGDLVVTGTTITNNVESKQSVTTLVILTIKIHRFSLHLWYHIITQKSITIKFVH